jgi:hypothetical protein
MEYLSTKKKERGYQLEMQGNSTRHQVYRRERRNGSEKG